MQHVYVCGCDSRSRSLLSDCDAHEQTNVAQERNDSKFKSLIVLGFYRELRGYEISEAMFLSFSRGNEMYIQRSYNVTLKLTSE